MKNKKNKLSEEKIQENLLEEVVGGAITVSNDDGGASTTKKWLIGLGVVAGIAGAAATAYFGYKVYENNQKNKNAKSEMIAGLDAKPNLIYEPMQVNGDVLDSKLVGKAVRPLSEITTIGEKAINPLFTTRTLNADGSITQTVNMPTGADARLLANNPSLVVNYKQLGESHAPLGDGQDWISVIQQRERDRI